jgi:hypothetical protein
MTTKRKLAKRHEVKLEVLRALDKALGLRK